MVQATREERAAAALRRAAVGDDYSGGMPLDLTQPVDSLTRALVDIPSVSGDEKAIADAIEEALSGLAHLEVTRVGEAVVARTHLGRPQRVILAGHIDTVPIKDNVPSRVSDDGTELIGRGTVLLTQYVEEAGIDVDALIGRTVERPDLVRSGSAGRRGLTVDQCHRRRFVAVHLLGPVVVENDLRSGHSAVDVRIRVLTRIALGHARPARLILTAAVVRSDSTHQPGDINAEQRSDEEDEQADDAHAATPDDRGAATASARPVAADIGVRVEGHGIKIPRERTRAGEQM